MSSLTLSHKVFLRHVPKKIIRSYSKAYYNLLQLLSAFLTAELFRAEVLLQARMPRQQFNSIQFIYLQKAGCQ